VLLTTALSVTYSSAIDAALGGLAISYAMNFMDVVTMFVRVHSNVEIYFNSVERIREYLELPSEAPQIMEHCRPPKNWPHLGTIKVENLTVRYAEGYTPVLKNITFGVGSGEKVGIVGATGAGKSTLALSFFRFLESSSGCIKIDGLDINQIGLTDLREALTIIPQDPILFNGTIRQNLDPGKIHSEAAIYHALRQVHLVSDDGQNGESRDINLDTQVIENGSNFSVGERALLCLARAFLRPSRVIIIDEATASIDPHTDQMIQETIRTSFKDCTILCIAHRLKTIMDFDRVLVLNQGFVVEYDTPYNLLSLGDRSGPTDGYFRALCENSGEFDLLCSIAEEAYNRRARHV
jgi:ABC-type multidrug transport system fused ATPase/permease subunit